MTNQRIKALLREAHQENIQEQHFKKICAIEDCMKAKRLLFGMGDGKLPAFAEFDRLYELELDELINNHIELCIRATLRMKELIKLHNH